MQKISATAVGNLPFFLSVIFPRGRKSIIVEVTSLQSIQLEVSRENGTPWHTGL